MNHMTTKDIGNAGETLACELLASKGYAIVGRNVVIGRIEIDILAMHANRIVIVEVKTRKEDHLDPDFGLDREKIYRLCRAGSAYVKANNLPHEVQIDAVLITVAADGALSLDHIEDIALPPRRRRR